MLVLGDETIAYWGSGGLDLGIRQASCGAEPFVRKICDIGRHGSFVDFGIIPSAAFDGAAQAHQIADAETHL